MGVIDQHLGEIVGQVSGKGVAVFLAASCSIYLVLVQIDKRRRRKRLGASAPKLKYSWPLGIDFVYRGIRGSLLNRNMEHWTEQMLSIGAWTGEAWVMGSPIIMTTEPENVKAILSTQFADFGKGEVFHRDFRPFLGDSIFSTDGDLWHASRQLIRPQFVRDRVSDLHVFETHVQTLFRAIKNGGVLDGAGQAVDMMGGDGRPVDMSDLFFRFALDASTDFLLGKSVDSMCNPRETFADAFDEASRVQGLISRANAFNFLVPRSSYKAGIRTVDAFINQYIDLALRLSPEELATKTKSDAGYTFLHAIASFTRDRRVLRDQIVAVLLAGRDTTAATLSFMYFELSKRPEVVAKLRREILATIGETEPPTYHNLKNMPYVKAVVNETLRLYPVVPYNIRVALRDTTLPVGGGPDGRQPLGVLKGTPLTYSPIVMQRRADLYPPVSDTFADPKTFSPERWEGWHPKGHEFVPFNAGPRICVGQQFALTEMAYVLCRTFQKFDRIENLMGEEGMRPEGLMKSDLTLKPARPIVVGFWEAKK